MADADLTLHIVLGVRRRLPHADFRSANEAGLRALPDPEVLRFAASEARILVSHDRKSMPVHFAEFLREGNVSPGVFLIPQRAAVGEVIDSLILILSASVARDWENQIHYVPSLVRHVF